MLRPVHPDKTPASSEPRGARLARMAARVRPALLAAVGFALVAPIPACTCGPDAEVRRQRRAAMRARRAREARADPVDRIPGRFKRITPAPDDDIEALAALGYLDGTRPPPNERGVTVLKPDAIQPGANLYVSGQGPEAHLIDHNGDILHKWAFDWYSAWPDEARRSNGRAEFPNHWRRAHLYDDGDLLVIWGGQGIARIDAASQLQWGRTDEHVHHDVDVGPDGRIWTLSRGPVHIPELSPDRVVMDTILVLDPETGATLDELSLWDALQAHPAGRDAISRLPRHGDILHTNTITVLPEGFDTDAHPELAAGNLLLSFRNPNLIGVLDVPSRALVWVSNGPWAAQHQPVLLDEETVLIFDNRSRGDRSRVLEANRHTGEIGWQYGGEDGEFFWSRILGSVQRLENGNTLITESDNGRAFEVTRDGERVWELVIPHRAGPDDAYIASLYELIRLPADMDLSWADPSTASRTVSAAPPDPE